MEDRQPSIRFEFSNESDAPRQARVALSPLFADPEEPIAEAVKLAASELVSNVVVHTNGGGVLRAWKGTPAIPLRLEVEDHVGDMGQQSSVQSGGRGLRIVNALANGWGVERRRDGKTVWAEFSRPAQA